MYFEVDPNDPSKFVYLTEEQMEALYREKADDYPKDLAELYLGFHAFARIEFLVFRDRLSAAIFLWRSTNSAADRALRSLDQRKGSLIAPHRPRTTPHGTFGTKSITRTISTRTSIQSRRPGRSHAERQP
ncbi:hypothetical protein IU438_27280 [Nocardia cyriacigeorgica]|uniref:hypothetical protein n=1 Tax=Nocardia cyriacigeorgica TaxID=135487 RepID=UPI00189621F5|nr:hypothetical protein [Nocardia cyriacigeorgica]MBF6399478.1 hypothetical protein [Nocardia cyriacigeorgica]MBF6405108.1 hypothetical protein [Nocardia cyriacigeorgica]